VNPTPGRLSQQRAMQLLPTLCTVFNLFFGALAIVKAMDGRFEAASLLILGAAVLDKLDGFVARAVHASSDFGRELDSLADVVSFGLAPALTAWAWALRDLPRFGLAAALLFMACGALRLARFNVQATVTDKRWFIGLPIPMAAAVPATLMFAHAESLPDGADQHLGDPGLAWGVLLVLLACAALMVSRIRYHAFKDVHFGRERRVVVVLGLMVVAVLVFAWPSIALPVAAIGYALHGPVLRLFRPAAARAAAPGPETS
jgi:CDP-diacylglycerol--serine O-phosphatidyltransferase